MLPSEVRDLFLGPNYAHVATLMSDGSPHTVPVWIDVDDHDRVAFYKENSSVGLRNLKRDPRVAVSITDIQNPYRSALVRGHVLELRWLSNLAVSYTGTPYPEPLPGPGTLVVVEAHHVGYHNSATMRHDPPARRA
jgi:PPOX class probable F420-dependent enzyme